MIYLLLALLAHTPCPDIAPETVVDNSYVSKLKVQRTVYGKEDWLHFVKGEVKNLGDRTVLEVKATIFALDKSGKPVFETPDTLVYQSDRSPEKGPLKPNYVRKFIVDMGDAPAEWFESEKKFRIEITSVVLAAEAAPAAAR